MRRHAAITRKVSEALFEVYRRPRSEHKQFHKNSEAGGGAQPNVENFLKLFPQGPPPLSRSSKAWNDLFRRAVHQYVQSQPAMAMPEEDLIFCVLQAVMVPITNNGGSTHELASSSKDGTKTTQKTQLEIEVYTWMHTLYSLVTGLSPFYDQQMSSWSNILISDDVAYKSILKFIGSLHAASERGRYDEQIYLLPTPSEIGRQLFPRDENGSRESAFYTMSSEARLRLKESLLRDTGILILSQFSAQLLDQLFQSNGSLMRLPAVTPTVAATLVGGDVDRAGGCHRMLLDPNPAPEDESVHFRSLHGGKGVLVADLDLIAFHVLSAISEQTTTTSGEAASLLQPHWLEQNLEPLLTPAVRAWMCKTKYSHILHGKSTILKNLGTVDSWRDRPKRQQLCDDRRSSPALHSRQVFVRFVQQTGSSELMIQKQSSNSMLNDPTKSPFVCDIPVHDDIQTYFTSASGKSSSMPSIEECCTPPGTACRLTTIPLNEVSRRCAVAILPQVWNSLAACCTSKEFLKQ